MDNKLDSIKSVLTKKQKRTLNELRIKMSENPDIKDWLQLELLDKQEKMRYTPGINSDYQLGQLTELTDLIRKINFREGGIDGD